MRLRIFDIKWSENRKGLPSVVEWSCDPRMRISGKWKKTLRVHLEKIYDCRPISFLFSCVGSHRCFRYENPGF